MTYDRGRSQPSTTITNANGQKLYRCEVERTYTGVFYVWAADRVNANNDAEELMADFMDEPGDLAEDDVWVTEARLKPERGETVWSGGPDGYWDDWNE